MYICTMFCIKTSVVCVSNVLYSIRVSSHLAYTVFVSGLVYMNKQSKIINIRALIVTNKDLNEMHSLCMYTAVSIS